MARLLKDPLTVRFEPGVFDRMDQVLKGGEIRAVFIRTAVENEIRRREIEQAPVPRRRKEKAA